MAIGYKDWDRGIKKFGSSSSVFVRITPGKLRYNTDTVIAEPGIYTQVLYIPGQGVFLGGVLYLSSLGDVKYVQIFLNVDGSTIESPTIINMTKINPINNYNFPIRLAAYDEDNAFYIVDIVGGFVFDQAVTIHVYNNSSTALTVENRIMYSLAD